MIVPRKTVGELRKLLDDADGAIDVSLSDTKIQFGFNGVELTSKLIDGNFPPYERAIPSGNDKSLALEAKELSFNSGLITLLPVLEAQRDLFLARRDHSQARYDYLANRLRLQQASGTLSEQDLVSISAAFK